MAFLESRLKQINDLVSTPSKEGGLAGLNGVKLGNFYGYHIYTVPLFHHSFKHWKKYLINNTLGILQSTEIRCNQQCENDANLLHGNTVALIKIDTQKCFKECSNKWDAPVWPALKIAEEESNKVFNKCLAGKIKNDIEYENVLSCKSVAFQDYMNRVLDIEEKYLNEALNKFA